MGQGEIIQYTVVAIIVLAAIVWAGLKVAKMNHNKGGNSGCGCCSSSSDCKIKELKRAREKRDCCRDGQSARN